MARLGFVVSKRVTIFENSKQGQIPPSAAIHSYEGIMVHIRGYRAITICDDIAILDGQIDVFATGGTSRHEII